MTTMIATITEVIQVSLRLGQVILRASARTSRKNWAGVVFFFAGGGAPAAGELITAAVLAARRLIADGLVPGFLAIRLSSLLVSGGACGCRAPVQQSYRW